MKRIFLLILILMSFKLCFAEKDLLLKARKFFEHEDYANAIELLERAKESSPENAEIYFLLGFYNHYRAYDSRPLQGYNYDYSQKIFSYLEKALKIDPNHGNAKYFYGAECSANAFLAMQNGNSKQLLQFYKQAESKGAYPEWLKEYGRIILKSCEPNAILFTGGNVDFDICTYLQLYEDFRKDVSLLPIGNINRPWYVEFMKEGFENTIKPIELNLTKDQIYDIHPFKWEETPVEIPVSAKMKEIFNLQTDFHFKWNVRPDLISQRIHSKTKEEKAEVRKYLSPQRAILLQILEDNFKERPIYFSNLCNQSFLGGLENNFQDCGLIYKLLPFQTENTEYKVSFESLEIILSKNNFENFFTIIKNDIPRISHIVNNYHKLFLNLAIYFRNNGELTKIGKLKEIYKKEIAIGFNPDYENKILKYLEKLAKNS